MRVSIFFNLGKCDYPKNHPTRTARKKQHGYIQGHIQSKDLIIRKK